MSKFKEGDPLPSYKKPPVIEVSFGVHFDGLKLDSAHLGRFWSDYLKSEFPSTQDRNPAIDVETGGMRFELMVLPPLRRALFISADSSYLVQLQGDRFYFNWRVSEQSKEYPRFDAVFDRFKQNYRLFQDYVTNQGMKGLEVSRFELVYLNHIKLHSNVAASLEENVRMFSWKPLDTTFLREPVSVNSTFHFPLKESFGNASASLSSAKAGDENILVLAMKCVSAPNTSIQMAEWFGYSREWIVRAFTELTTEKAHESWGRTV
jgi:uncharacterized protein (TIGR04255 family)